jgi:hypothetical protein
MLIDFPCPPFLHNLKAERSADVTVIGAQYRDSESCAHWCFAVWSERSPVVRTYWISAGELPKHLIGEHRKAVLRAIKTLGFSSCDRVRSGP